MVPKTGTRAIKRGSYIHKERALDISGNRSLALPDRAWVQAVVQPQRDDRRDVEKADRPSGSKIGPDCFRVAVQERRLKTTTDQTTVNRRQHCGKRVVAGNGGLRTASDERPTSIDDASETSPTRTVCAER